MEKLKLEADVIDIFGLETNIVLKMSHAPTKIEEDANEDFKKFLDSHNVQYRFIKEEVDHEKRFFHYGLIGWDLKTLFDSIPPYSMGIFNDGKWFNCSSISIGPPSDRDINMVGFSKSDLPIFWHHSGKFFKMA